MDARDARAYSVARWTLFGLALAFVLPTAGACGDRTNLDDLLQADGGKPQPDGGPVPDGSPDVTAGCGPSTCGGCCDAAGECQLGTDLTACGLAGASCVNCKAEGFLTCDPSLRVCGTPMMGCAPGTCKGCCASVDLCVAGTATDACGANGVACAVCAAEESCNGSCTGSTTCGPENCRGCCEGNTCVAGDSPGACGSTGQACADCSAPNQVCAVSPGGGVCISTGGNCDSSNCPGCCSGGVCMPGMMPNACGQGGQACVDCGAMGEPCVPIPPSGGACLDPQGCNPETCAGCCLGNAICVPGTTQMFCGSSGEQCQPCMGVCEMTSGTGVGGICVGVATCGPQTCAGCCDGTVCLDGLEDGTCGGGGGACQNCSALGESCLGQRCVFGFVDAGPPPIEASPPCDPTTCSGCCDASGVCEAGFLDGACGQGGVTCDDCSAEGQTCDTSVSPRACTTNQCPAPYPGCGAQVTATPPSTTSACSPTDLTNAQAACTGGATTGACQMFFQFEQTMNPSCGQCLAQFDQDFASVVGIIECLTPFLSSQCQHPAGCYEDCVSESCASCSSANLGTCQNGVRTGQCSSFFSQLPACVLPAIMGQGAVCNPNTYGGNFGAWLAGVGKFYCAP